jgi:hypothetical protein
LPGDLIDVRIGDRGAHSWILPRGADSGSLRSPLAEDYRAAGSRSSSPKRFIFL